MEVITQLIGAVGFPIVAFLLLFYYIITKDKDASEERKLFTEAINNNTLAINNLTNKLNKVGGIEECQKNQEMNC